MKDNCLRLCRQILYSPSCYEMGSCLINIHDINTSASQEWWPVAAVSPRNWVEMQIRRTHPKPIESKTLGWGPNKLCFNKLSRLF